MVSIFSCRERALYSEFGVVCTTLWAIAWIVVCAYGVIFSCSGRKTNGELQASMLIFGKEVEKGEDKGEEANKGLVKSTEGYGRWLHLQSTKSGNLKSTWCWMGIFLNRVSERSLWLFG